MIKKRKYLFGPIPSRRLGLSLGIDLVPYKTCSMDCIYCECGATTNLTLERKEYVPTNDVIEELDYILKEDSKIDYVTFSGSGEPTLHSGIGKIIEFLKLNYSKLKICLLTNSTLLIEPEVTRDIAKIDLIVPSLDTVELCEFREINRPYKNVSIDKIIESLINFKNYSNAKMWLEILILKNINDSIKSFKKLIPVLKSIQPDKIQLNTLDRPGVLNNILPVDEKQLIVLKNLLNDIVPTEIIAKFAYINKEKGQVKVIKKDITNEILTFISRRPCTQNDILFALNIHQENLNEILISLIDDKKIKLQNAKRGTFYSLH